MNNLEPGCDPHLARTDIRGPWRASPRRRASANLEVGARPKGAAAEWCWPATSYLSASPDFVVNRPLGTGAESYSDGGRRNRMDLAGAVLVRPTGMTSSRECWWF